MVQGPFGKLPLLVIEPKPSRSIQLTYASCYDTNHKKCKKAKDLSGKSA